MGVISQISLPPIEMEEGGKTARTATRNDRISSELVVQKVIKKYGFLEKPKGRERG